MADPFVAIDTRNLAAVTEKLNQLGTVYAGYGVEASNEYIVNTLQSTQPPYSYVSRAEAYPDAPAGPGWFSIAQRRYVMAAIARGDIQIPYRRTQETRKGWTTIGVGENQLVVNEAPAAVYLYDDARQANMSALRGWPTLSYFARERSKQIADAFAAGVRKAIARFRFQP